ncbi:hypothetical protein AVEN_63192-1 [Araneus ventricosus]|uniref:Mos1 transposase HTH domain-containing protein n=1 Tax=Araneus ventricosus TaxID=182803 RepID=A0A4Y2B3I9_ARAVE|nr:hypothetical protein AVEN_63192-1 [Araneus ventricosus]
MVVWLFGPTSDDGSYPENGSGNQSYADKHYGDSEPPIRSLYKWFGNFRSVHMNIYDAERPGRPDEVITQEIIEIIHDVVTDDRTPPHVPVPEARTGWMDMGQEGLAHGGIEPTSD